MIIYFSIILSLKQAIYMLRYLIIVCAICILCTFNFALCLDTQIDCSSLTNFPWRRMTLIAMSSRTSFIGGQPRRVTEYWTLEGKGRVNAEGKLNSVSTLEYEFNIFVEERQIGRLEQVRPAGQVSEQGASMKRVDLVFHPDAYLRE